MSIAMPLPAHLTRGTSAHRHFGRALRQAFNDVPAYHALWQSAGVDAAGLDLPAEFDRLPVVTKQDLLRFPLPERCLPGLHEASVRIERTSGSTGQPFEVPLDRVMRRRRQRRFFKALLSCGYRPGQRLLLLSTRSSAGPARFLNWRYASITLDEAALAAVYREFKPAVLYGPLNTLLTLAGALAGGPDDYPRPRLVISTAEELTPLARQKLVAVFGVEPADFFGLTETGLLAWRKPGKRRYRLASDDFLFEFLPSGMDPSLERLVVTDLTHQAMPLVRFDTGDLVRRDPDDEQRAVLGFTGREVDSLALPGGRRLSPYRVTLALEEVPGLLQYRVTQHEDLRLHAEAWTDAPRPEAVLGAVRNCLRVLTGECLPVTVVRGEAPVTPERKFRPIRSLAREAT